MPRVEVTPRSPHNIVLVTVGILDRRDTTAFDFEALTRQILHPEAPVNPVGVVIAIDDLPDVVVEEGIALDFLLVDLLAACAARLQEGKMRDQHPVAS